MKQLLAELFKRYYKDVYTYLYSLCRDASLSEDLASEVFLEMVRSITKFRGESDVKTWLFTIARRKWFAHLRKQDRQIQTESIHELLDSRAPYTTDEYDDLTRRIHELLETENPPAAAVVRMRIEGYSYYEIAAKCGISENSARVIYFRTKSKIKTQLEKEGFSYD